MTRWEMLFILFAGAFTLEEYTASTEHGWISEPSLSNLLQRDHIVSITRSLHCKCTVPHPSSGFVLPVNAALECTLAVECIRLRLCRCLSCVPGAEDSRLALQRWYILCTVPPIICVLMTTPLVSASTMAFDILACGACILFPRYGCLDVLFKRN